MFEWMIRDVWDKGAAAVQQATNAAQTATGALQQAAGVAFESAAQAVDLTKRGVVGGTVALLDGGKQAIESTKKVLTGAEPEPEPRRRVFVIHGRNLRAWRAMSEFLEALDLRPYNYDAVQGELGSGSPFVGEVVHYAMRKAHAVVALFTPDEFSVLDETMRTREDREQWQISRWQARPNVIFEAGMAFGISAERTVIVTLGTSVELFSDVRGRVVHSITDDSERTRERLAQLLAGAGCRVRRDRDGRYLRAGNFKGVLDGIEQRRHRLPGR